VRHVRDEVAADLVGFAQLRDVMQDEDGTVRGGAGRRRRGSHDRP
jgi:hypothetical protein